MYNDSGPPKKVRLQQGNNLTNLKSDIPNKDVLKQQLKRAYGKKVIFGRRSGAENMSFRYAQSFYWRSATKIARKSLIVHWQSRVQKCYKTEL